MILVQPRGLPTRKSCLAHFFRVHVEILTRRSDASGRSASDKLGDRMRRRPSVKSWYGSCLRRCFFIISDVGWVCSVMRSINDLGGAEVAWTDPGVYDLRGRRNRPLDETYLRRRWRRIVVASSPSDTETAGRTQSFLRAPCDTGSGIGRCNSFTWR